MTLYIVANWFLCLLTSAFLFTALWRYRFLVVKPSIIVIIFFHLMIQWAATVNAPEIETYLPRPWDFVLLAHGFPLIGLSVAFFVATKSANLIWQRLRQPRQTLLRPHRRAILILAAGVVVLAFIYLRYVPLSSTGLYAIFTDPLGATQARENSLTLVENSLARYAFSLMASTFAPLLSVLLAVSLARSVKRSRLISSGVYAAGLVSVLGVVSLTGARGFAASIVLTLLFAWFLRKGLPINPLYIAPALIAVLVLPTLFTLLRQGEQLTLANFWLFLTTGIVGRVFYVPMQMGLWHAHYAQTVDFIGIAGVPRLATLFGVETINVPNMIARIYGDWGVESTLANSCYVFSYYAYFGLISLPISLLGLWGLDLLLWIYRRLSDTLLVPCVASVSVASTAFISVDYTIVLLTSGLAVIPILAWILDWLGHARVRLRLERTLRSDSMPLQSGQ